MHKTMDARYVYHTHWGQFASVCRLRIYETPFAENGRPTVFIAGWIDGTIGLDAFAERLGAEVAALQRARRRLGPGDPRHEFVWLEHYPVNSPVVRNPEEMFRLVTFQASSDGRLTSPAWQMVGREYVEGQLLGGPLDD